MNIVSRPEAPASPASPAAHFRHLFALTANLSSLSLGLIQQTSHINTSNSVFPLPCHIHMITAGKHAKQGWLFSSNTDALPRRHLAFILCASVPTITVLPVHPSAAAINLLCSTSIYTRDDCVTKGETKDTTLTTIVRLSFYYRCCIAPLEVAVPTVKLDEQPAHPDDSACVVQHSTTE